MIICEIKTPRDLKPQEIEAWHEFCGLHEKFKSPLLSPEFFFEIAKVRDDVYCAIYRDGAQIIGFLPHHRRPNNFARPVGAPFSDYSAFITPPEPKLNIHQALELAKLEKYRAIGWIDPYGVTIAMNGEDDEAHGMDLISDVAASSAGKKHRKNVNRLRRHLIDAYGEVHFICADNNEANFRRMLELKSEQTRKTGVHDFTSPPWVKQMFENLWTADKSGLHGALLTMYAGEKPIAWQFGPKLNHRMHPWIFSYEPEEHQFSPGQIYLMDCADALRDFGVVYNDLSTGGQAYKVTFCNNHFPVKHGIIYANPDKTPKDRIGGKIGNIIEKLDRRFDQIATLELETKDRIKGATFALLNASKRI